LWHFNLLFTNFFVFAATKYISFMKKNWTDYWQFISNRKYKTWFKPNTNNRFFFLFFTFFFFSENLIWSRKHLFHLTKQSKNYKLLTSVLS
jgi:hypothetical protein